MPALQLYGGAEVKGRPQSHHAGSVIQGTATLNPSSLADGVGETLTMTVAGARLGDAVQHCAPYDLQGITVSSYVQSSNLVAIRLQNESGGVVDLASGTWRVLVT